MKTAFRFLLAAWLGGAATAFAASGTNDAAAFKDDREKASYAIGMVFGTQLKNSHMDVDVDLIVKTMKETLAGKTSKLADTDAQRAIGTYQQQQAKAIAEKNSKASEKYFAEQRRKPGVQSVPVVLPDGATNEFFYKVMTEGTGETPKPTDQVKINFQSTLIDGKEVAGQYGHAEGVQLPLMRVPLRGLAEALQRMKPGAKWELYLPAALAFGERGMMNVEPGAPIVVQIELLSIEAPKPPPAPNQPMTSEIIRVPSAEDMKRGEQIERIKPEDIPKWQTNNAAPKKP